MKGSSWDGLLLGAKTLRLRPLLSFDELPKIRWKTLRRASLWASRGLILGQLWMTDFNRAGCGMVDGKLWQLRVVYVVWNWTICASQWFKENTSWFHNYIYLGCLPPWSAQTVILSDLHPRKIWVHAFWTCQMSSLCSASGREDLWVSSCSGFLLG